MPEDIGKELLMLGGTLAGFIAALLTVMEKLIDIRHRLGSRKDRKTSVQQERQTQDSGPSVDFFSTKPFRGTSYLLMYETGVIVSAGLLLNYVGLTLSRHLESILYLDMTGTALVALLSNSVINWLLFPQSGADVMIFPWSLVSMTGAVYWGWMARQSGFQKYLRTGKSSALSHAWFLYIFGVAGAAVMSVPGTFIQAALN